jgi:hypothetical protein
LYAVLDLDPDCISPDAFEPVPPYSSTAERREWIEDYGTPTSPNKVSVETQISSQEPLL